jgi:phosphoribosylamine--glycine ligase
MTVVTKNFLFVSVGALIGDIAWMVRKEGHEVRYFIETESERSIADGFVEKVEDWESHVDWADVIVFDDVLGQGEKAKKLREAGKHVIGGTPYTDRLEDDRSYGQEELKRHGVSIIPFQDFSDFDSAIDYVSKHPAPYVIKPSGEAQNIKRLLFVGQEDDGTRRNTCAAVLQSRVRRYREGLSAAAARARRRSRSWCVFQWHRFHDAHQRKFRTQAAVPRKHRTGNR